MQWLNGSAVGTAGTHDDGASIELRVVVNCVWCQRVKYAKKRFVILCQGSSNVAFKDHLHVLQKWSDFAVCCDLEFNYFPEAALGRK